MSDRVEFTPPHELRRRQVRKWAVPSDVLAMALAEPDTELAPPVRQALVRAVESSMTGYHQDMDDLSRALQTFMSQRWHVTSEDLMMVGPGVNRTLTELLRLIVPRGGAVLYSTPVYHVFRSVIEQAGGVACDVPLLVSEHGGYRLDLQRLRDTVERIRPAAILLCNPHNPLGTVHHQADLVALAAIAARWGVTLISDETHAPLTHDGRFSPIWSLCEEAAELTWSVVSAAKAWNLSGVKCAIAMTQNPALFKAARKVRRELEWDTSRLAVVAATAAFGESVAWLEGFIGHLRTRADLLMAFLAESGSRLHVLEPDAGYLVWLDCRATGWGDDPAGTILEGARIAVTTGTEFGPGDAGHCRMNIGCSAQTLTEALHRLSELERRHGLSRSAPSV